MPPQRTIPPAKAIKTERTHEENQERAYIAASRRSDRTLEARVESARRASEIHKKRTGRSLRVTEQDVINEEMYEEEDDDLPAHYRNLARGYTTNSYEFNRRLSAFLTTHVAMRSAIEQDVESSYNQRFPTAAQYVQGATMYQSPMMLPPGQQLSVRPNMHQNMMPRGPQQAFHPYAMQQQPAHHSRSASIAFPQEIKSEESDRSSPAIMSDSHRRASMPSTPLKMESPQQTHTPQPVPHFNGNPTSKHQAMPNFYSQYNMPNYGKDILPFTTALPPESQMFLGATLDPNDPLNPLLMSGSENLVMPNFDFNTTDFSNLSLNKQNNSNSNNQQSYNYFEGLDTTLSDAISPGMLEMQQSQSQTDFQFNPSMFPSQIKPSSGSGSAAGTPGLNDQWDQWIDSDEWAEMPTASQ